MGAFFYTETRLQLYDTDDTTLDQIIAVFKTLNPKLNSSHATMLNYKASIAKMEQLTITPIPTGGALDSKTTLQLKIGERNYLMNGGGLLVVYKLPPAGYTPYQLAKLVLSTNQHSAVLEIFITSPFNVTAYGQIFPVNSVLG